MIDITVSELPSEDFNSSRILNLSILVSREGSTRLNQIYRLCFTTHTNGDIIQEGHIFYNIHNYISVS